jgi:hypothetical protein
MGGLVCQMVVRATLTFTSVPTEPSDLQLFDNQMREIHKNTEYAQSVINETSYAAQVIEILERPSSRWNEHDRETLLDAVAEVCGKYG